MKTLKELEQLLDKLDGCTADDLEGQDLDFKRWGASIEEAINTMANMAVCMANAGGGTVVFGVADRIQGREKAILGVPNIVDIEQLKRAIYNRTSPSIKTVFEELFPREGTGRLLVILTESTREQIDEPRDFSLIDFATTKARILELLISRAKQQKPGLSNEEIRRLTKLDRFQINRLMKELKKEHSSVINTSKGRYSQYIYSLKESGLKKK